MTKQWLPVDSSTLSTRGVVEATEEAKRVNVKDPSIIGIVSLLYSSVNEFGSGCCSIELATTPSITVKLTLMLPG